MFLSPSLWFVCVCVCVCGGGGGIARVEELHDIIIHCFTPIVCVANTQHSSKKYKVVHIK